MPEFQYAPRNAAMNAFAQQIAQLSLHSAYHPLGAYELASLPGAPLPYARITPTFTPASQGFIQATGLPYIFNVPPASTVAWLGLWDITQVGFLGMIPNGGTSFNEFVSDQLNPTLLRSPGHGLTVGQTFVVWYGSGYLPSTSQARQDLAEGTIYYVASATLEAIEVTTTLGGPPLTFPLSGAGFLQAINVQTFPTQNTFPINSLVIGAM